MNSSGIGMYHSWSEIQNLSKMMQGDHVNHIDESIMNLEAHRFSLEWDSLIRRLSRDLGTWYI